MRPLNSRSSSSDEHAEAVSRRLATLSAELAAVRGDPPLMHRHTQVRGLAQVPAAADTHVPASVPGDLASPSHPAPSNPSPSSTAPVVPMPGRHASRGQLGGLAGDLSSRLPLSGAHVAAIAVAIALAVGVAAWFAIRSDPEPVPPLLPVSESLVSTSPDPAQQGSSPPDASGVAGESDEVTVDVAGKVRRPGIAVLEPGSRVVDAVEAAGGARRGVDLTSLNLARPLVDGEQILVGVPVPAGVVGSLGSSGAAGEPGSSPLVNLNTADLAALDTLPGVGPVTAEAILAWRSENGGFTAVAELLEVDGIGDATLADIAPHVTL